MKNIIGRKAEQAKLAKIYRSNQAEFVAIYGRRRVGKTFLVKEFFTKEKCLFLQITGNKKASTSEQIYEFTKIVSSTFYGENIRLKEPKNWLLAFELLTETITKQAKNTKVILFFDELPWLASKRSRFLQALDYYWNRYWTALPNITLIVCGSAASWIIENILNNKGGLHNRITLTMLLEPFTLQETKQYLHSVGIKYLDQQILNLYLIIGGIPHYLRALQKGLSVAQNIDQLCFNKNGILFNEFNNLYAALFNHHEIHEELIRAIASKRLGISRKELLNQVKKISAGGRLNVRLQELEEAGFISCFVPYGNQRKGVYYKIIDEYTLFYLKWIEPATTTIKRKKKPGYWQDLMRSPSWHSWSGLAFEALCFKHIDHIMTALNIPASSEISSWRYIATKENDSGVQIDLLFDRPDGIITICEIKYSKDKIIINKQLAQELVRKIAVFKKITKTKKQIMLGIISVNGVTTTAYSDELLDCSANLQDLLS